MEKSEFKIEISILRPIYYDDILWIGFSVSTIPQLPIRLPEPQKSASECQIRKFANN
jgi:hypothetical protein